MSSVFKIFRDFFGIIAVGVVFLFIALMAPDIVSPKVAPPIDVPLDQWVDKFTTTLLLIWLFSTAIAIIRYIIEAWVIKNKNNTQRLRWFVVFIIVIVFSIVEFFLAKTNNPTTEGNFTVGLWFILIGALNYYFATALFSPVGIKYSAPLSIYIRRFW